MSQNLLDLTPDDVRDYNKRMKLLSESIKEVLDGLKIETNDVAQSFRGPHYDSLEDSIRSQKQNLEKLVEVLDEYLQHVDRVVDKGYELDDISKGLKL